MRHLLIPILLAALCGVAAAGSPAERAGWLLDQADATEPTLYRAASAQSDVGGGGFAVGSGGGVDTNVGVMKHVVLSAIMPGLGEVTMGYRRGWLMMAVDVYSWTRAKHYHDLGNEKKQAYFDYADAHWSEEQFRNSFGSDPFEYPGTFYYHVTESDSLSLWVSVEADRREYYENLGKWDQFVFGWDDFSDPRNVLGPEATSQDLKDNVYGVSDHRMTYRAMREDANDQFDSRDRYVYFNMATRLFSMLQVAYLGHLFGGGGGDEMALDVGGHKVALIAEGNGWTRSRLGLSVSY